MRTIPAAIVALAVCCLAPVWAAAPAAPEADDEPLLSVNGHLITSGELDRHLRMLKPLAAHASGQSPSTALELAQADEQRRKEGLQALIELRLLYDVARDEYLRGEESEQMLEAAAEEELRKFEERVGSMPAARRVLAEVGLTIGDYKDMQKQYLLTNKLLWDKVFSRVFVTPTEQREYYDGHPDEFAQPRTVIFRQMLFIVVDEAEEQEQRARAVAALARLRAGEAFVDVARELSADAGADPSAACRVGVPETAPDWLPPAVDGLEPGETSEVRRLSGGYSVARLEEVRPPGPRPFEEIQPAIKDAMLRFKRATARAAYIGELRAAARIEYLPAGRELAPQ